MATLNKVYFIGNLGADPELKIGQSGKNYTTFSMAVSDRDSTHWFNITAFDKLAEVVTEYTRKGSQVMVEGRAAVQQWEGEDGKTLSKIVFIAENVQFLGPKPKPAADEQTQKSRKAPKGK